MKNDAFALCSSKSYFLTTPKTSNGSLRCFLDTGATWNILHAEALENQSPDHMALDPDSITKISTFQIGGENFGPIAFRTFPVKIPVPIEAILGMEFFLKNKVFIDFANQQIYISKNEK